MFDPTPWSQLGDLMFTAKGLVDGLYAGGHASTHHGPGAAFHDYRPYVPGESLAAVDWKVFGRTDRYYVRRAQRDSELHVQLLVDVTASMAFASLDGPRHDRPTKLTVAKQLAAAIAFLTIRQGDRAGVALAADRLREALPMQGGWPHLQRLCAVLEHAKPGTSADPAGDWGACLRQWHAMRRRRGLVVMVSDLLDEVEPLLDGVSRLRHARCDVLVFQVLSLDELSLSRAGRGGEAGGAGGTLGWRRLVDAESSRSADVRLANVGASYDRRIAAHVAAVRSGCQVLGARHELVRTDQPVLAALRRYLASRGAAGGG